MELASALMLPMAKTGSIYKRFRTDTKTILKRGGGAAHHRGSIRASHPAAPGSNLGAPDFQLKYGA